MSAYSKVWHRTNIWGIPESATKTRKIDQMNQNALQYLDLFNKS